MKKERVILGKLLSTIKTPIFWENFKEVLENFFKKMKVKIIFRKIGKDTEKLLIGFQMLF